MPSLIRLGRPVLIAMIASLCLPALARAQAMPSGKEVLDRYIEVTGGRDAYANVKTRVTDATLEAPAMGIKGKMKIYQQAPDKGYIETNIENVGKIQQGSDGTLVWEQSAMTGPRLLEGQEKESLMRSVNLGAELTPEKYYKSIETTGTADVEGKPAYKVELTSPGGSKETRYYDKESGLLVKTESTQQTQMGEMQVTGTPSDYQEMAGIKMPKKMTQNMMNTTITITLDKVEQNVDIPADKFQLPADVKALVDKKNSGGTSTTKPATQPR